MMPEEDEELASGGGIGDNDGHQPEHQHASKRGSSRNTADRNYYSSSSRDRDRDDDYHHRSNRDRDRERSHRDRDHRDRYRDRDHRDREYGGRYRDHRNYRDYRDDYRDRRDKRSRSRSKESRSRDRDRHRSQRDDRTSRDAPRTERTVQDRLSAEIEQELANLRRQHDLKEALKKQQKQGEGKGRAHNNDDDSQDDSKPTNSGIRMGTLVPYTGHSKKQNSSSFLPKNDSGQPVEYVPEIQTEEERIEFQRKMQEKLQQHLAAEGKLYPPPAKPNRDAPAPMTMTGFANDGSFLEMFKKLQQQAATGSSSTAAAPMLLPTVATIPAGVKPMMVPTAVPRMPLVVQKPGSFKMGPSVSTAAAVSQVVKSSAIEKEPPPPVLPVFGRRRGGKILKTGMVKKVRPVEESTTDAPNDAWTLYLQEVKKYKSASCDADSKTRPLVK
uniref:Uncharacterized protein n=1 Tax=Anopheles culicifacies TaxID=139723 RepID=A0A182M7R3_9DIPT